MPEAAAQRQELWVWRHPRAEQAQGRCIGRTELRVDARRAKRLAHRIRQAARRHHLPHEIWTSPRLRCREVGRWLRRWGWRVHVDDRLAEIDFGAWDGLPWSALTAADFGAWEADFLHHRLGGGESLAQLLQRVQDFVEATPSGPRLVVGHGGWINALRWLGSAPCREGRSPGARHWPPAPGPATLTRWLPTPGNPS